MTLKELVEAIGLEQAAEQLNISELELPFIIAVEEGERTGDIIETEPAEGTSQ